MDMSNPTTPETLNGSDDPRSLPAGRNVKYIWGYPGGAVLYIRRAAQQDSIEHVLVRHEQAAVHAADGYARATATLAWPRDLGSWRDQRHHWHRDGLHGLDPHGDHHRSGFPLPPSAWMPSKSAIPSASPAHRQAQLPGQGRGRSGRDHEEGLPHRPHRPSRPGGGRYPEGRFPQTTAFVSRIVEMRSYNPVRKGHGGQIRKAVNLMLTPKAPLHLHRRWCDPG